SGISPAFGASCDSLSTLGISNGAITSAQLVAAGEYTGPPGGRGNVFEGLPAFCKVTATLRPSKDSDIRIEVWLPASGWNGKFQGVSGGGANGALEGALDPAGLAGALRSGFSTATTDTRHQGATM